MAGYRQIDTNLRVLAVNLEAQFKNEDVGATDLPPSLSLLARRGVPELDRMVSIKKEASPFL